MGYDYSTVDGRHVGRLHGREVSIVMSALANGGLLDEETRPPPEPQSMLVRHEDPESFEDDDSWPLDVELPPQERAWFGFRSPDPERVPAPKLVDNSPWLIDAAECALLRAGIHDILAGAPPRMVAPRLFGALAARGVEDASAEIERCLRAFREIVTSGERGGGVWSS